MNLFDRAKNILLSPKSEWEVIKTEETSINELFTKYAMILAAIPSVAGLIGYSVFGLSFMNASYTIPFGNGITWAVLSYVMNLAGVYVTALVIDALAPSFGAEKDLIGSLKIVIYAETAVWVAGIFSILPALSFLSILGLYSLYLLYLGMKSIKNPPAEKMVGYFVVTIIVLVVVYLIIGAVVMSLTIGNYIPSYNY